MGTSLIILDFDGTLIDSRADLATAVNLMRRDYGLPALPVATVAAFVGDGVRKLVARSLQESPAVDLREAVVKMRGYYREHMFDMTQLYPGTVSALADLRAQGYGLAIVSNKPQDATEAICRHLGIAEFLAATIGGDTCPQLKPHPEPLYLALRMTDSVRQGSWVVGDNHTDMAAGRNAGLMRCFCTYGFGQLGDETYDLAVASLAEFAEYLKG